MFRIFALALVLALSVTAGEASILALSVTSGFSANLA